MSDIRVGVCCYSFETSTAHAKRPTNSPLQNFHYKTALNAAPERLYALTVQYFYFRLECFNA